MRPQGIALFRKPFARECTLLAGDVETLGSVCDLDGRSGFVVAPFAVDDNLPVVLMHPVRCEVFGVEEVTSKGVEEAFGMCGARADDNLADARQGVKGKSLSESMAPATVCHPARVSPSENDYPFEVFHDRLMDGGFQKLVLSRSSQCPLPKDFSSVACFRKACESYPRLFIALVYTPQTGLWLTATPEVLLDGMGHDWQTMALAGTMKCTSFPEDPPVAAWSDKNIQEQRLVASYMSRCLQRVADDFTENGPYTVRAAHLVHLRSDFSFSLPETKHLGRLLAMLHPTPAVCGLPKEEARDFILAHEPCSRRYYSGFMGMLEPEGHTFLYVSLRCMQISATVCRLYAGGGLLKDSRRESEWDETETKMETMRRLLNV